MAELVYPMVCSTRRCRWHGTSDQLLRAPDPFNPGEELNACPACRDVDAPVVRCDEAGCLEPASCGTPMPAGYRQTCGKHAPRG